MFSLFLQIYLITFVCALPFSLNRINLMKSNSFRPNIRLQSTETPLDIGEFENVQFTLKESLPNRVNKYQVIAVLKPKDTNGYLNDYKEEIKKRGVIFPGFRPGKLPPHVMPDIRRYIVCFGLERLLGELCNLNGLKICDENGSDVPFGEDSFYEKIVADSSTGKKFQEQRDTWREGTDFPFVANFYAIQEEDLSINAPTAVEEDEKVIDVEAKVE